MAHRMFCNSSCLLLSLICVCYLVHYIYLATKTFSFLDKESFIYFEMKYCPGSDKMVSETWRPKLGRISLTLAPITHWHLTGR